MELLTKENRKKVLGKDFFFANELVLTTIFSYQSGIKDFDKILQGRSQKKFKAIVSLYVRKSAVEIKLHKSFKSIDVGIPFKEINKFMRKENKKSKKEVIEELKKLQRLYQISPSYDTLDKLIDQGLHSASQIINMSKTEFIKEFGNCFNNTSEAEKTYNKVVQVTMSTSSDED